MKQVLGRLRTKSPYPGTMPDTVESPPPLEETEHEPDKLPEFMPVAATRAVVSL